MKRLLLLIAACLTSILTVSAQVTPTTTPQTSSPSAGTAIRTGNWLVGGSVGSTNFNFETETFNISLNPRAGYFISDRLAIGALVTLGLDAYNGGTNFQYGIGPFARYYFPEGGSPTNRWFGEANVGIAGSHREDSDEDNPVSLQLGVAAGYAHFITPSVALEGMLGYTYSEADINSDTGGSSGIGLTLGFQVYLPGRRNR
jgi:hypothetical protein